MARQAKDPRRGTPAIATPARAHSWTGNRGVRPPWRRALMGCGEPAGTDDAALQRRLSRPLYRRRGWGAAQLGRRLSPRNPRHPAFLTDDRRPFRRSRAAAVWASRISAQPRRASVVRTIG